MSRVLPGSAGFLRAAALLAPALLLACGTRVSGLYERPRGSPAYSRITKEYTRSREVHDGLDTRFIIRATWLSPEWTRAFSEEYANIYYLDGQRKEQVLPRWMEESEAYARFFVALFTPDDRTNDLDKPDTLWSLHLIRADEVEYAPVSVRATSLRPAEVTHFFPYSETWFRDYEVAFPREAVDPQAVKEGAPRLKLVLTGVQGRAVLAW